MCFQFDVYALLDLGARYTLSFVTSYVTMKFECQSRNTLETFSVSTSIGESIVAKQVYRMCLISISHKVIPVILVFVFTIYHKLKYFSL